MFSLNKSRKDNLNLYRKIWEVKIDIKAPYT